MYFDKNNKEIQEGMTIRHDNGDIELVYLTTDDYGDPDLGINATNQDYLRKHPDAEQEFYSLSEFDMKEWVIVE